MFISDALSVNENGVLTVGGCDAVKLAEQYSTPLYVIDETQVRKNCCVYKDAFDKLYNSDGLILYSSKAFLTKEICRTIHSEGLGIDVVSGGELYTALSAGFPADKIYFHGNYKNDAEIKLAVENGIRCITVDNEADLYNINRIASHMNKTVRISLRLKPGVDAHTHKAITTGHKDSKFGIDIESGEAFEILCKVLKMPNIKLIGVHCHIGSQIFEYSPFENSAIIMLNFIKKVKEETGYVIGELNLGGGYGVKYTNDNDKVPFGTYIEAISKKVKEFCRDNNMDMPFILMEPGRSIVADAGITLYKVGCIKDIENIRKYIIVDGSMTDNPRYALYGSKYECVIASKPLAKGQEVVTIAGRTCESGDIIIKDYMMPEIKEGDILAVLVTGAYNYSMSSNYNRLPRPAVVMTNNGVSRVIVKAETYEDIIRNDI